MKFFVLLLLMSCTTTAPLTISDIEQLHSQPLEEDDLLELLNSPSSHKQKIAVTHKNTTSFILMRALLSTNYTSIKKLVVKNPLSSSYMLIHAARQESLEIQKIILEHPNLNQDVLEALLFCARSNDLSIEVLRHPKALEKTLLLPFEHGKQYECEPYSIYTLSPVFTSTWSLRQEAVVNPNATFKILLTGLKQDNPKLTATIVLNNNLPQDLLDRVFDNYKYRWDDSIPRANPFALMIIAKSPKASKKIVLQLLTNSNINIVKATLNNPQVTREVILQSLSEQRFLSIPPREDRRDIASLIGESNLLTPQDINDIIDSGSQFARVAIASRQDLTTNQIEKIALGDEDQYVVGSLLHNHNLPVSLADTLLLHPNHRIVITCIDTQQISPRAINLIIKSDKYSNQIKGHAVSRIEDEELLTEYSKSLIWEVRYGVAKNPLTPPSIIERLLEDKVRLVRSTAKTAYIRILESRD